MLDEKDLQAIAQLMTGLEQRMDQKLTQQETKLSAMMDQNLAQQGNALEQQGQRVAALSSDMAQMKEDMTRTKGEVMTMMEAYFDPKFDLLAEGLQSVNEKLAALPDPDLLEKMQSELDLQHEVLKLHTQEISKLKKAQ